MKSILHKLLTLELTHTIDLTGKSQQDFKRKHSTTTTGLTLLASALNDDKFALMESLDLSAAFDVVNVKLLLKRLVIIGLPNYLINLISKWLQERYFYVTIGYDNSFIHWLDLGTVQGSILGSILYAIFVSPLFDLEKMTMFTDDNYGLHWNKCLASLIDDMKKSLESTNKWLRNSGLKVNESRTKICLFHRKDHQPIKIPLFNRSLLTKSQMNALGVTFVSKLQSHHQVQNANNKSKKSTSCNFPNMKILKKLLNTITSSYYSILWYNGKI